MTRKTASTRRLEVARLDEHFDSIRADSRNIRRVLPRGWIHTIRTALGMSAAQLAKKLGVTRAAVYQLENREVSRSVSIKQLDKVAEALNCDVVYAIVPREGLEQSIRGRAREKAEKRLRRINLSMGLEAEGIADQEFATAVNAHSSYSDALTNRQLWDD